MDIFTDSELIPSRCVAGSYERLPAEHGVYGLCFDSAQLFLERSGYLEFDKRLPLHSSGFDLLYAGATGGTLRHRVREHLCGDSRKSSFRQTVGALLADELDLEPEAFSQSAFGFGSGEWRLTDWLLDHTAVVFLQSDYPFQIERDLLAKVPLPLNITGRRRHPFSRYLTSLRQLYACRPKSTRRQMRDRRLLGLTPLA